LCLRLPQSPKVSLAVVGHVTRTTSPVRWCVRHGAHHRAAAAVRAEFPDPLAASLRSRVKDHRPAGHHRPGTGTGTGTGTSTGTGPGPGARHRSRHRHRYRSGVPAPGPSDSKEDHRGKSFCLMAKPEASTMQMMPTVRYAPPRKLFFPPIQDDVLRTIDFVPSNVCTGYRNVWL